MRKELERIEIPDEHEARERSLAVVRAAFAEHEPQPQRRSWKPIAAIALALVVVAGLLSPPGRAVLDEIREVVGVEKAQPALFSLPAPGRLLVTADSGAWVVEQDGSKRLLGPYREASWSPFGRFVVASRPNELVALTPEGEVRWSLARPNVRFPRWGGTRTDTRIAYITGNELRVVGGDGKGDRVLDRRGRREAPVWRPGGGHVLAYARADGIGARGQRRHGRGPRSGRADCARSIRAAAVDVELRRSAPATSPSRCGRRTAAGSRPAGRRPTSSSSSASVGGRRDSGRLERVEPVPLAVVSDDQWLVLRTLIVHQ